MPHGYSITHHPQIGRINELIANGMSSTVIADAVKPKVHKSSIANYRKMLMGPARPDRQPKLTTVNNEKLTTTNTDPHVSLSQHSAEKQNTLVRDHQNGTVLSAALVTARIAQKLNRYPQLVENAIACGDDDIAVKWDGRENTVLGMAADIVGLRQNNSSSGIMIVLPQGSNVSETQQCVEKITQMDAGALDVAVDIKAIR